MFDNDIMISDKLQIIETEFERYLFGFLTVQNIMSKTKTYPCTILVKIFIFIYWLSVTFYIYNNYTPQYICLFLKYNNCETVYLTENKNSQ